MAAVDGGAKGGPRRPAGLLHRDEELAQLDRTMEELAEGRSSVVAIHGPRGIGKTALLRAALARVPRQAVVLRARCHESERNFPYGVVRQLFDRLLSRPGRTGTAGLELRPGAHAGAGGAEVHEQLQDLFQAARSLSDGKPVVIAVDDLTFADQESLAWLSYIVRRLDGLPLALVYTAAPDAHDAQAAESDALAHTRLLRPGPLCESCAAQWMAQAFGAPLDTELAAACHTLSLGNPLVLGELTDRLLAAGVSAGSPDQAAVLEIGAATLSDTTVEWLSRRHPAAVELLANLAVLGPGADITTAAALADQGEFETALAGEELRRSGLIDPGPPQRFRHELVRTAILSRIEPKTRLDLHARAAALLLRLGAPAAQTAEHLMSVGATGQAWALPILRTAAREAAAGSDWANAARYLRRALAESADPEVVLAVTSQLGAVELHRDVAACARYAATVAASIRPPAERARALLPFAGPVLTMDSSMAAHSFVEAATALEAGHTGEVPLALRLPLATQALLAGHRGTAHRTLAALRRSPDDQVAAPAFLGALAALTAAGGRFPRRAQRLAERCANAAALIGVDTGAPGAALALAWTGRAPDAAALADRTVLTARGAARPGELALALVVRADIALRLDRTAAALGDAREALRLAESVRAAGLAAAAAACTARALVAREQYEAAATVLSRTPLPAGAHPLIRALFLQARGLVAAGRGAHGEALQLFLECGHALAARGIANPECVRWRADAGRAYEALGEPEAALAIAAPALPSTRLTPRGAGAGTGMGVGVAGSEGGAGGAGGAGWGVARSGVGAGVAAAASGVGSGEGARPDNPAPADGPGIPSDTRRRVGLTASERRVTDLVLTGLSNLEVAERLFLSKRTVDTHLGRIYRKLEIRGRVELADALRELGDIPEPGRTG
ncbi:ATP-binding protein [Streptomyces sp. NPDC048416]|uniref:ATP-binding protein n=1 Tax=Streptomyces sp. NPDC048416 TaxID=3365546 RepID=UPI00371B1CD0